MRDRTTYIGIIFLLGVAALISRLFWWQILNGPALSKAASLQQTNRQVINAHRGNILARDGSTLAGSGASWRLFVYRPDFEITDAELVEKLSPVLVDAPENERQLYIASESARLKNLLAIPNAQWISLDGRISREKKTAIERLDIKGLGFESSEVRMYPEASMSAHLLGFVGKGDKGEDIGYFGLEGHYDLLLSGKAGIYETEANALGVPLVSDADVTLRSFQGADLITSIDKRIQLSVENRLKEGLAKYEAEAGSITVMDPKTGEVLAMASFPAFSPLHYYEGSDLFFRNPIISDSFEPGSIMKPIVMAAGFDAGVITPSTICDICSTAYRVGPFTIRTWNNQYYANSSMQDVIKHSDNVGMVFIGNKLGTNKLYDYFTKFGFGKLTNIDLQGEFGAPMRKLNEWGDVERNTASFGQGIAVTSIQMLNAISVIANKGVSVTPHVVREIQLGDWKTNKKFPQGVRVISEQASRDMTDIMVGAVKDGEAKWAAPKGYDIAGKTGTAQVAIEGQYDETKTNASFIGFAPAHDPKFAMLVTLKQPKSSPWASETAAPLWFKIAIDILHQMGIGPTR